MKTISVATHGLTGIFLVALSGAPVVAAVPPPRDVDQRSEAALDVLEARLEAYAALRRRVEGPLPPLRPTTDMHAVYARRAQLASAIKAARPDARRGDILTFSVAAHLRRVIRDALKGVDVEAMLLDLYGEHEMRRGFRPQVHDAYPEWATRAMPAILLLALPPLPDDIEYRLIGYDLVLLDTRADLIIDVSPRTIPSGRAATSVT